MTSAVPPASAHEGLRDAVDPAYPTHPVGALQDVLAAVSDPVRLEMVRRLGETREPVACGLLYSEISKSTASHHFKILREAGLTERSMIGGRSCQRLRLDEVESAYPGVLRAILDAARTPA